MNTAGASAHGYGGAVPVALALQGGGSHGAFTWGVLDALLADGGVHPAAVSGTSAGAVNAVALAAGWGGALSAAGGDAQPHPRARSARAALSQLWTRVGELGQGNLVHPHLAALLWGGLPAGITPDHVVRSMLQTWYSPYHGNPLDWNPLRTLLEEEIDFAALGRPEAPPTFVAATAVRTGKAAVFHGAQLNVDAVLASACLPTLFRAVDIDGEPYWDGGFSANPPLAPLVAHGRGADIVLVQINPVRREALPQGPADILDRASELGFNASLLAQLQAIDLANRLIEQGRLRGGPDAPVRVHRIDGGDAMLDFPAGGRTRADPGLIRALFALGQSRARQWLDQHRQDLGRRSSIDIAADYLDATALHGWLGAPSRPAGPAGWRGRLAHWLARLRP